MHILHVVGARPNFMKAAPVLAAFREYDVRQTLVHTGQHYDALMSDIFFQQLGDSRSRTSTSRSDPASHAAADGGDHDAIRTGRP